MPAQIHFLIGYTEQLLSFWLHCPIRMELSSVPTKDAVVYKYI